MADSDTDKSTPTTFVSMSPISFLSLPTETHFMVYKNIFSDLKVFVHSRRNCSGKSKLKTRNQSFLGLFLACKKIYWGARDIFFDEALFTIERRICRSKKCHDWAFKPMNHGGWLWPTSSPHRYLMQHIECDILDYDRLLPGTREFKEIILLVDWDMWAHLVGLPNDFVGNLWQLPSYASVIRSLRRNHRSKIVLQREVHDDSGFSALRGCNVVLPARGLQKIVFERGGNVTILGVEEGRQSASEEVVRRVFSRHPRNEIVFKALQAV